MRREYISISMIREELDGIPNHTLPHAFSLKWYQPGDEQCWLRIQQSADRYNQINLGLFRQQFGDDAETLGRRQCFILNGEGRSIGTATAWFDLNYRGQEWGRVHWVAIVPEMQGQGLAKPLMTVVCQRLRKLGHERACLTTAPERIPAVNLYLKFGFVPEVRSPVELRAWKEIEGKLGRSVLNLAIRDEA
jgi:GNAT superfamily N-acetyltransferase